MAIQSIMKELGAKAPAFSLPIANPWIDDLAAETRSFDDYPDASAYVIVFTCNHCPYAVHIERALTETADAYRAKGVQFIAICSNDPISYPEDSFEKMAERARQVGMSFPYLHDTTQDVARAYGAACTPDFFVYDGSKTLLYRGQFDETRPNMGTAHGGQLKAALDYILDTGKAPENQYPSIGCSIKWRK